MFDDKNTTIDKECMKLGKEVWKKCYNVRTWNELWYILGRRGIFMKGHVAQLAEHWSYEPKVAGSTPAVTNFFLASLSQYFFVSFC